MTDSNETATAYWTKVRTGRRRQEWAAVADRPLSIGDRVVVKTRDGSETNAVVSVVLGRRNGGSVVKILNVDDWRG